MVAYVNAEALPELAMPLPLQNMILFVSLLLSSKSGSDIIHKLTDDSMMPAVLRDDVAATVTKREYRSNGRPKAEVSRVYLCFYLGSPLREHLSPRQKS